MIHRSRIGSDHLENYPLIPTPIKGFSIYISKRPKEDAPFIDAYALIFVGEIVDFPQYDSNIDVNPEIYKHLARTLIRILPNMKEACGDMEKEMKHGAYPDNPTWLLADSCVPGIRNFSKVAIGPLRDITESPKIAQLGRIVNPTSEQSQKEKVADKPKDKVVIRSAQV